MDAQGTVVWQAAYLPYGEAQILTASVQNNLRFPGQYFDAETGLHYNWNRYYNPKTGRYITADPIGLAGGMNLYAYVGGNPVNAVDVEGLANLNLFKPGSMFADQTDNWNPKGYYSISGHGAPTHMEGPSGEVLMPKDVAAMVLKDKNFKHQPIYLDSCSVGKGDNSFAQLLANELGVEVTAPTEDVKIIFRIRWIVDDGIDKIFYPQVNIDQH